ncbi:MAG: type I restriction enzyme HsdR N-terminal domain-containing protein [Bacteroidota bacterium]
MSSSIVPLNLPKANLNLSQKGADLFVVCLIRKKKIVLTPEEWVRQHILSYLLHDLKIAASLIAVEAALEYNQLKKRSDVVVFDGDGKPTLLVECKAPAVKLSENVYQQIASYNAKMNVRRLLISNGIDHLVFNIDSVKGTISMSSDLQDLVHS